MEVEHKWKEIDLGRVPVKTANMVRMLTPDERSAYDQLLDRVVKESFDRVAWFLKQKPQAGPPHPPELKPIHEAAKLCGIHENTLYHWISAGKVPIYGRRGAYRVDLQDVMPRAEPQRKKVTAKTSA